MFRFSTRGLAVIAAVCFIAPAAQAAVQATATTVAIVKQAAQQIEAGQNQAAVASLASIPTAQISRTSVQEIRFIGELLNAGQVADARQAISTLATDLVANDAALNGHEHEEFERGKREGYHHGRRDRFEHRPYNPWTHEGGEHFRRGYHEGYEEGWRSALTANASTVAPAAVVASNAAVSSLDNNHEREEYERGKQEGYRHGRRDRAEHRPYEPWTHEGGEHFRRGYHDGYEEGYRH